MDTRQLMDLIVPEAVASGERGGSCGRCGESLEDFNSTVASRRYDMCSECVAKLFGDHVDKSLALFLAKGVIMICHYGSENVYKLRVELRSAYRSELDALKRELGVGSVYDHSRGVYRFSVASLHDLDVIGQRLMPFLPVLAAFLQRYTVQPNKMARSAFAEAAGRYLGYRSIHFIDHI